MDVENMNKLRSMSRDTGSSLSKLVELYSKKQTQYLKADLRRGVYMNGLFGCDGYGERSVSVFQQYISRKGAEQFKTLVDNYKLR